MLVLFIIFVNQLKRRSQIVALTYSSLKPLLHPLVPAPFINRTSVGKTSLATFALSEVIQLGSSGSMRSPVPSHDHSPFILIPPVRKWATACRERWTDFVILHNVDSQLSRSVFESKYSNKLSNWACGTRVANCIPLAKQNLKASSWRNCTGEWIMEIGKFRFFSYKLTASSLIR